jgi:hypothetical protein
VREFPSDTAIVEDELRASLAKAKGLKERNKLV